MPSPLNTATTELEQWFTLDDFPEAYPNFNRSQIEWLHRHRATNGFAAAFRKIGKRRYLHATIFAECLHGKGNDL
jgi:hypothetical protein